MRIALTLKRESGGAIVEVWGLIATMESNQVKGSSYAQLKI
jgi:hypothetical protein